MLSSGSRVLAALTLSCIIPFIEAKQLGDNETETQLTNIADYLQKNYPKDAIDIAPTNVSVGVYFFFYDVFGLGESEVMELNGWVKMFWIDRRLSWKPERWSNLTSLYLSASKIWKPDIGFSNSKKRETKDFSQESEKRVQIKYTGEVSMFSYFISQTPCPIETFLFPFDRQLCPLVIGTSYSNNIVIKVKKAIFENMGKNTVGEWIPTGYIISADVHSHYLQSTVMTASNTVVSIILKRKPLYHIVLVLIPYCLTSVIANLLFILKPPNERLRVSLSVLLSMTVYVMIVSRQAPKSMRGPSLLGSFLLSQMLFLVLLTFAAVLGPLLFPKRDPEVKDVQAEEGTSEEEVGYRILGRKFAGWSRHHDHLCLVIHVIASCLNGIICLFAIPLFMG